jgi:hypothetical protein
MILEASFTLIYDVYNTCITYYELYLTIINDASRFISEWWHNLEHYSIDTKYDPKGIIVLIYDVYYTCIAYHELQLTIVKGLRCWPQVAAQSKDIFLNLKLDKGKLMWPFSAQHRQISTFRSLPAGSTHWSLAGSRNPQTFGGKRLR